MTAPLLVAMPGNEGLAASLAEKLGVEVGHVETRRFPDGRDLTCGSWPTLRVDQFPWSARSITPMTSSCPCSLRQPRHAT